MNEKLKIIIAVYKQPICKICCFGLFHIKSQDVTSLNVFCLHTYDLPSQIVDSIDMKWGVHDELDQVRN